MVASTGARSVSVIKQQNQARNTLLSGILSGTRSKPIHKLDFPAFDWPVAHFPRYKYPPESNAQYNEQQDDKSINSVRQHIADYRNKSKPVACVLVEPIQAEGGDHHASAAYFRRLQQLCKDEEIAFIVDEASLSVIILLKSILEKCRCKPAVA